MSEFQNNPSLTNPTLEWDGKSPFLLEANSNKVYTEEPRGWRYFFTPHPEDANRVASSLHKADGFEIGGGWRSWVSGYEHILPISARKNQRYLLKVVYTPEVVPGKHPYTTGDLCLQSQINGRYMQHYNNQAVGANEFKWLRDFLTLIEADADGTYIVRVGASSKWAFDSSKVTFHSIQLLEVGQDYSPGRQTIITPMRSEPVDDPPPTTPPTTEPPPVIIEPPVQQYPALPTPEDSRWKEAILIARAGNGVLMRAQPRMGISTLHSITDSDIVFWIEDAAYTDDQQHAWYPVKVGTFIGWVIGAAAEFIDLPDSTPTPPAPAPVQFAGFNAEEAMLMADGLLRQSRAWHRYATRLLAQSIDIER